MHRLALSQGPTSGVHGIATHFSEVRGNNGLILRASRPQSGACIILVVVQVVRQNNPRIVPLGSQGVDPACYLLSLSLSLLTKVGAILFVHHPIHCAPENVVAALQRMIIAST